MSVVETALVFGGIPLGVVVIVAGLILGVSASRGRRYRPDLPFEFAPVWFVAPADTPATDRAALPAGREPLLTQGGAHDTW